MSLLLERRLAPRRVANIQAEIGFRGTTMRCVIRNVSEGGAKLEFSSVAGVPNSFELLVPGHRPQSCRVVWRTLKEIGVTYEGR